MWQKKVHLYIVGKTENYENHAGKQYRDSSKNQNKTAWYLHQNIHEDQ